MNLNQLTGADLMAARTHIASASQPWRNSPESTAILLASSSKKRPR